MTNIERLAGKRIHAAKRDGKFLMLAMSDGTRFLIRPGDKKSDPPMVAQLKTKRGR